MNMKNTVSNETGMKDIVSWMAIAVITIIAFWATYYFSFAAPIKALIWIGWLVLTLVFAYLTAKGKEVLAFAKDAKIELQKVVWPTRQETVQTTSIVMIMVAVTGFVLWGIDSGMLWVIGKITHLG